MQQRVVFGESAFSADCCLGTLLLEFKLSLFDIVLADSRVVEGASVVVPDLVAVLAFQSDGHWNVHC